DSSNTGGAAALLFNLVQLCLRAWLERLLGTIGRVRALVFRQGAISTSAGAQLSHGAARPAGGRVLVRTADGRPRRGLRRRAGCSGHARGAGAAVGEARIQVPRLPPAGRARHMEGHVTRSGERQSLGQDADAGADAGELKIKRMIKDLRKKIPMTPA